MRSIRGSLFRWLFLGLGLLWVVAGISLYVMIRSGLQARFDADLSHLASAAPLIMPTGDRARSRGAVSSRWAAFFEPGSGQYLQMWTTDGAVRARSASLGTNDLPRPADLGPEPRYWNFDRPNGERLRATGGRVDLPPARGAAGPGATAAAGGAAVDIVVARDRSGLARELHRVIAVIAGAGLLVALGFALFVRYVVGVGLQPLRRVGEQAAAIDTGDLKERFAVDGMPEELWPILDRLNDLMARLESGFERERRFSANLAHELRTPVTELKTAAEVALRWPDQAPEQVFRDVLDISGQMQTIVESLLILARPGRLVPEEPGATVSLAALAADCWRPYARRAEEKGLHVEFAADLDRSLTSHAGLLRLILSNLFSNAVEYTPSGGRICVASRAASAGRLDLAAGNSVGGFDPADLPHLFERFWRRDPARTGGRHHGLGLCVAKACAEALACDLTADFDPANAWLEFRLRSREGRPPADAERNFTT